MSAEAGGRGAARGRRAAPAGRVALGVALVLLGVAGARSVVGPVGAQETAREQEASGVAVSYQLPAEGPLPRTYRVTLAITEAEDPDWIVSTFVAGGVRTVTAENQGRFTDYWNGLDENDMPLPPGEYGVKGIYMPAEEWKIDGKYHTLIPRLVAGVGDSWFPPRDQDERFPWVFGHAFGGIADVQVGPNGIAGFWASYLENAYNPFLVDLNREIGYDQVLAKYGSGGTAGGTSVACDGEQIWAWSPLHDPGGFLFRADRRPFGTDRTAIIGGVVTPPAPVSSLWAWHDEARGKRFLYAAMPSRDEILTYDGDSGAVLATTSLAEPTALIPDRAQPGSRLRVMHRTAGGEWVVSEVALAEGLPAGEWRVIRRIGLEGNLTDGDMDSQGNLYVVNTEAEAVHKLDPEGRLVRFVALEEQVAGQYRPRGFMGPARVAVWRDREGRDRVLVVERSGPGRVSEWTTEGELLRQWFLIQNANHGYWPDPARPEHIYVAANFPLSGKGLVRYRLDYETGEWDLDAVWPDICRWDVEFPSGRFYAQMFFREGNTYLAFPYMGGLVAQHTMIYKLEGEDFRPSAGLIREETGERGPGDRPVYAEYWWTDRNGDGVAQEEEWRDNPTSWPAHMYWGDQFGEDMSILVMRADQLGWAELPLEGFDEHGNPLYDGSQWRLLLTDPIYEARRAGVTEAARGGNEVANEMSGWARIAGSREAGYYVADPSGPPNPGGMDNAGSRYAQFKLSYYEPAGEGEFRLKWRVGRKAWRLAEPGQVYATQHLSFPAGGLVGTWDSNGLYHVYTDEGMYVDTVMVDAFAGNLEKGGVYVHSGEAWYGKHFANERDGKVYLFAGRPTCTVYEVPGWTVAGNPTRKLEAIAERVVLRAADIAAANEHAVLVRGGAGRAPVARFVPAPGGGPALDGSLRGWESAPAVEFGLDAERAVEVRCMYDPEQLYLRWRLRLPEAFVARAKGNPNRIFTHERQADTLSFYLQGDREAEPGGIEGRPGDTRVVFAVVEEGGELQPIALGMYPEAPGQVQATPMTYLSPTGRVSYEHVGLIESARLGWALEEEGRALVIAAAIPVGEFPRLPRPSGELRTLADFSATLGGRTAFWWANTGGLSNTNTTDEPSEARLYPGSWAQAQFEGMDKLVVRDWQVMGPWGGERLRERPFDPHPQPEGHGFTKRFFTEAEYPPDGGQVDLGAVYRGPLTQDVKGNERELRWRLLTTAGESIEACQGMELGYAATWIHAPEECELEAQFLCPPAIRGGARVWVNGEGLAESDSSAWGVAATAVAERQRVRLAQGWNEVVVRVYSLWGGGTVGLHLEGPEEELWGLRVSPYPPE